MKKFDLPLWSDTVFFFFFLLLLSFCVFRCFFSYLASLALSAACSLASASLLHRWRRRRRRKKHADEDGRDQIRRFAFHLAMSSPEKNAELIARSLCAAQENEKTDAVSPSETLSETSSEASSKASSDAAQKPYARACGDRIRTEDGDCFLNFRFEKVTADELAPAIRRGSGKISVCAAAFTDEAKKLASAFGVRLMEAEEVYALVNDSGCMPPTLISPPAAKHPFKEKLSFRIRKSAWRGYAFSGTFLLLFSLWTVFPVYYIVSGSILLTFSLLIRFFGKKD